MSSKFLSGNIPLNNNLSNLSSSAQIIIQNIVSDNYIDTTTGQFKTQFIPTQPFAGSKVYIVADEATRLAIPIPLEGSFAVQQDNSTIWIYDDTLAWVQLQTSPFLIDNLTNVTISGNDQNHILSFNNTSMMWENQLHSHTLNSLSDVIISTPGPKHAILYDDNTSEWKNEKLQLSLLSDVGLAGILNDGDILEYSTITSKFNSISAKTYSANDITDITISVPITSQGLFYTVGGQWTNQDVTFLKHTDINFGTLQDLDFMTYNFSGGYWTNTQISYSLDSLTDVNANPMTYQVNDVLITNNGTTFTNAQMDIEQLSNVSMNLPVSGHSLVYNFLTTSFENRYLSINEIQEFFSLNPAINDFLRYNGTFYVNSEIDSSLDHIKDFNLYPASDLQIVRFNSTLNQFINSTLTMSSGIIQDTNISVFPDLNDLVYYDTVTSKWLNGKPTKPFININGTTYNINFSEINNNIHYRSINNQTVRLTIATFGGVLPLGSIIEIINNSNSVMYIEAIIGSTAVIKYNSFTYCDYYSKLILVSNSPETWVFTTNGNGFNKIYNTVKNASTTSQAMILDSHMYVIADKINKYFTYNFKNTSGFVTYRTYDHSLDLSTFETSSNVLSNTSSMYTQNGTRYFMFEWNSTNITVLYTDNLFFSYSSIALLASTSIIGGLNSAYDVIKDRLFFPYMQANNFRFRFIQPGNLGTGNFDPGFVIASPGPYICITGYHKNYPVGVVLRESSELYWGVSSDPLEFKSMTDNQGFINVSDTRLTYIDNENMNDDFYCIGVNDFTFEVSIYKMFTFVITDIPVANSKMSKIFTFPIFFRNNGVLNNAVKIGHYIYLIINTDDFRANNFINKPTLIRFDTITFKFDVNYNPFDITSQASGSQPFQACICSAPSGIFVVGQNCNTGGSTFRYIKYGSIF